MKNTKKFLLVALMLAIALSLFACGPKECKHTDEDENGKCDKCGESLNTEDEELMLFENGMPKFQFVTEAAADKSINNIINDYIDAMEEIDVEIDVVKDVDDKEIDCEILVGNISNRDEKYTYDTHALGVKGYVIKIIDKKIIINGGSADATATALEKFIEDILKYDEDTVDIGTLYMKKSQEVLEVQSDYKVTAIKVNDTDIRDYTIAINMNNITHIQLAKNLQAELYKRTGYWLEVVSIDKADKSIIIKGIDKVYDDNSFKIYANDKNQLIVECAFENKLIESVMSFVNSEITNAEGVVNFKGDILKKDISFLTYEEFGAKGDGKTNDYQAIYDTHVSANKFGQTVKANQSATYYIENTKEKSTNLVQAIPIKTNVYWGMAKFTIDDTNVSAVGSELERQMLNNDIFRIESDYEMVKITDEALITSVLTAELRPGTKKVELGLDYPAMIIPYNDSHRVYRRKGYGSAAGAKMHEVIVLDKNGNIDESTPVMFTYNKIDYIEVYRLDIDPITVDGGIITTIASKKNTLYTIDENSTGVHSNYIARALECNRSFTTIKNTEHYVIGEATLDEQIDDGETVLVPHPYLGFFTATKANEVTFENCTMSGRRCYTRPSNCVDGGTSGTYDLYADEVNKIVFKNCKQTNFWITVDSSTSKISAAENRYVPGATTSMSSYEWEGKKVKMHWGVGGTNFCKNMEYIDSTLSRFDAHAGLYNGKIIRSTVNYIALTGNGEFIVEDTEWYSEGTSYNSASIFHLRADYGSTWEGNITVKNLDAYVDTDAETYLFMHTYNNWFYGYTACFPNLSLENLDLYDISGYTPLARNYPVYMMQGSVNNEPQLHLSSTAKTSPVYCYVDADEDGLVDGTDKPYVEAEKNDHSNGITISGSRINLNPTRPPEYIKILKNDGVDTDGDGTPDGGYVFIVPKTEGKAPTSDNSSEQGGFFGATKFYYSDTNYYLGTGHSNTLIFSFQ